MVNYSRAYRRYGRQRTPWEHYASVSGERIVQEFARETRLHPHPLGRAIDLGCGRGTYTAELARLGWDTIGIDAAPEAIEGAQDNDDHGVRYVLGDVTDLAASQIGSFDLFVDIGCFQGLAPEQRLAMGRSVTSSENPDATLLMFAFGRTRLRSFIEGVTQAEIEQAFAAWTVLSTRPAPTAGLGWPMNRTAPQWYRLRLREAE